MFSRYRHSHQIAAQQLRWQLLQTGEDRFAQRATLCQVQRTGQRAKMSGAEMGKRTTRLLMEHQRLQPRRTQPRQKFLVPGNVALR